MKKSIKILILLTSLLISNVSINTMEQPENAEVIKDGEGFKGDSMKINIDQLFPANIEIIMNRKMVGPTLIEQATYDALDELKEASKKISTSYLNRELKNG